MDQRAVHGLLYESKQPSQGIIARVRLYDLPLVSANQGLPVGGHCHAVDDGSLGENRRRSKTEESQINECGKQLILLFIFNPLICFV